MHKYFLILFLISSIISKAQIITTIAGNGVAGYNSDGILAINAELYFPEAVVFDSAGNLYIADGNNNRVRKVNTSGIITTIAGTGVQGYSGDNGVASAAELYYPTGLAFDTQGNLYITDWGNSCIRKINSSGIITTFAGTGTSGYSGDSGLATSAQLAYPYAITFDISGNLYIAEELNSTIRKVNTSGIITTIAGTGTAGFSGDGGLATSAQLNLGGQMAFDSNGNLFLSDVGNNRIRKINTSGIITTIAGTGVAGYTGDNGPAISAKLNTPFGMVIDSADNICFSDAWNNVIRKINTSGTITTIVGNGFGAGGNCTGAYSGDNGPALLAELNNEWGLTLDTVGNLYIADGCNNRIRKVTNVAVGVNELKIKNGELKIYPNPTSNSLALKAESISNYQNSTIIIQNIVGQTVKKLSFTRNIDVSELSPGCYFLQITLSGGENYKAKFIKQ